MGIVWLLIGWVTFDALIVLALWLRGSSQAYVRARDSDRDMMDGATAITCELERTSAYSTPRSSAGPPPEPFQHEGLSAEVVGAPLSPAAAPRAVVRSRPRSAGE
jgi:hypothetical protein